MSTHVIRTAVPDDLTALRDIYRRSSLANEDDRASLLANPQILVFDGAPVVRGHTRVAVVDGCVVGFATTRPEAHVAELDDLFVDPDWMRRGVATDLVTDAVEITRAGGQARLEVIANRHALAFYEHAGFVVDGEVATEFGSGLRMHLDVAPPA